MMHSQTDSDTKKETPPEEVGRTVIIWLETFQKSHQQFVEECRPRALAHGEKQHTQLGFIGAH